MKNAKDPWSWAAKEKREYITTEDIAAAIDAGVSKIDLFEIVLLAISKKQCEDYSCCAFVTLKVF